MERLEPSGDAAEARAASYRHLESFSVDAQGHRLRFFPSGPERLKQLVALIDGARTSLKVAFYIFAPDAAGCSVRDALVAACRRGVRVSVILDSFGSSTGDSFFADLREAGGRYRCFMPRWGVRYLIRNHQKMVIADDEVAMLGGFNIEDSYFAEPAEDTWSDLGFTVEGPLARRAADWFAELEEWTHGAVPRFKDIRRRVRRWDAGEEPVQLLIGGPIRGLSSWARCVGKDLLNGERFDLLMAYFSPSRRLLKRIRRIARKGRARLVLPGRSDNPATVGASRALYGGLLRSKARIWEFQPSMLHTKLIVLDDAVYLGSANLDMRSLYLNLEIVVRIEDSALAERMRQFISDHIPASIEVTRDLHARRSTWWNRARWWASWFLVAVVDYTVSRKLNLGLGKS